ncbi:MAG: translation initiation factor IF-2 associated domain-containing protein, partial [Pseudorhodoplanes sp.]|nr:translation initiation factor IF-2 associated domain-containing protein [Pseudorhodoplanes sp.]
MSETKNPGEKKLSVGSKTLTLKRGVEQGTVRQSFSHGRSKQVVVEKVKRRVIGAPTEAKAAEPAPAPATASAANKAPEKRAAPAQAPAAPPKPSGVVLRTLTDEERNARAHALADARVREAEERRIAEEEARRRASRETIDRADREAAEARKREEDERHKREEEAKRKAETEAKKRFGEEAGARPAAAAARPALEMEEDDGPRTVRR